MSRIAKTLTFLFLLCSVPGFSARAAEVILVPSDPVVAVGDTFTVDIEISLNEGAGEQLAGGIIDLGYEDGVVEIIAVTIDPYWDFLPDPGSKTGPDQWEGIGFDAFVNDPATGSAVIARVTLEALAAGTSQLAVLDSSQFFSATALFVPILNSASIRVNTLPTADSQTVTTDEDTAGAVTLTGSDPDGDDLTYAVVAGPANGTLSGTAPDLTYSPTANFNGSDSFTFRVNDGHADSNIATVAITVAAVNDRPTAGDSSVTTSEDVDLTVTLTGGDVDGDPLIYNVVTDPAHGSLSGTAPNLTYTPAADFNGGDGFTFQVNDGSVLSNLATVTITVNAVNDAPVVAGQAVTTDEDAAVAVTLTGSDIDGDDLTFSVVTGSANGTLSGTAPDLTYSPTANFNGSDSFTFRVNDGHADSNIATVAITVNALNDAPLAVNQAVATDEDTAAAVTLAGSDIDGDVLSFSVVGAPSNGTLSGSEPNLTYTPDTDFFGDDSFTFLVNDGSAPSNLATVTITVNAVNDAPVADDLAMTTDEDTAVAVTLTGSHADADPVTFFVVSGPTNGMLSGTAPNLTYTPEADFNGSDSFSFRASDGSADSNLATVSITVSPVADAPVADDLAMTTSEDTAAAVTLAGSDADGDPVTFSVVTGPSNGTLSGTVPNLTYTPDADFYGSDSFTYEASAGGLDSNIATVSITVNAVNDAPLADAGFDEIVIAGSTVILDGSASSDGEGDALTFSWTFVSMPDSSTAVFSDPAAVSPSFVADLVGDYVVALVASDGSDDSAPATVTITADVDTDIDGVPQSLDNCTAVANADQRDTDGDGYGNLCDGDLNNDGAANTLDLNLYRLAHRTELGDPAYDPDADFNGDDSIDTLDLNIYRGLHRQPLGPSCCAE